MPSGSVASLCCNFKANCSLPELQRLLRIVRIVIEEHIILHAAGRWHGAARLISNAAAGVSTWCAGCGRSVCCSRPGTVMHHTCRPTPANWMIELRQHRAETVLEVSHKTNIVTQSQSLALATGVQAHAGQLRATGRAQQETAAAAPAAMVDGRQAAGPAGRCSRRHAAVAGALVWCVCGACQVLLGTV